MFRFEYANGNNTPVAPTLASSTGGSLSPGTYYFWLQYFNRVGGSRFSSVASITLTTDTLITVTIPSTARPDGVDAHHFTVHYYTSNAPASAQQVARYEGYGPDQVTPTALPADIDFTLDEQLEPSVVVASPAALPTSDLINGMLRGVASLASVFRYDASSTETVDNVTVLSAAIGRWILQGSYSTYITDTTSVGGMAQLVSDVVSTSVKAPPAYAADGSPSTPMQFYINPGRSLGEDELAAGTRLGLVVFAGGVNRSAEFSNLIDITFNGYVNLADGTLDTGVSGSGSTFPYQDGGSEEFVIPELLSSGFAYSFSIQLKFDSSQTNGFLVQGDAIQILARQYVNAGQYFPGAGLVGNAVIDVADHRRIVPRNGLTATAKAGSVIIGNLISPTVAESIVTGFTQDTADQKVAVNGNGACYIRSGSLQTGEDQRAIVSTEAGTGPATAWSSNITVALNDDFEITCAYPSAVRADYPDVVAGEAVTTVTLAQAVTIYIQNTSTNTIRAFEEQPFIQGTSQVIDITDWSLGTNIGTVLPTIDADYGLFVGTAAPTIARSAGSSGTPAGTYRVSFAFSYPTGESITRISHKEADGCIRELNGPISGREDFDFLLLNHQASLPVTGAGQIALYPDSTNTLYLREESSGQAYAITGSNAETTVDFVQPTEGATVTVSITNSRWIAVDQYLYVEDGGTYQAVSVPSTTSVELLNPVGGGNVAPSTTIPLGSLVTMTGANGKTGIQGVSGFGFRFLFSSLTTSPPATQQLRMNAATFAGTTDLYVSKTDRNSKDLGLVLGEFTADSLIEVKDEDYQEVYGYFKLTGATDNGTHWTLGVDYRSGSGTITEHVSLTISLRGDTGEFGGVGIRSSFSATTTAPPGSQEVRLNNATPSLATEIYVDYDDRNSTDQSALLALLIEDSVISLINENFVTSSHNYRIISTTDNTTYYTLSVAHISGSGSFAADTFIAVSLAGAQGATGSVSSASGIILAHTTTASTGADESFLFVDSADQKLKIRAESNGAITEVGSGGGSNAWAIHTSDANIDIGTKNYAQGSVVLTVVGTPSADNNEVIVSGDSTNYEVGGITTFNSQSPIGDKIRPLASTTPIWLVYVDGTVGWTDLNSNAVANIPVEPD